MVGSIAVRRSPKRVERACTRVYARCMHDDGPEGAYMVGIMIVFIIQRGSGSRADRNFSAC